MRIRSLYSPDIIRLRVTPDEPEHGPPAIVGARPPSSGKKSRRPHTDTVVARVRHLIENSVLTYSQISAKTGVGRASISRWTRDQEWQRPLFAPRATDRIPTARAGRRLRMRMLATRLEALAEHHLRDLEQAPQVETEALMAALQVLKMARPEAQGHKRRRKRFGPAETGEQWCSREDAIHTALKEMRRGGVDLDRAPQEALDLVIAAAEPLEESPMLRERGQYSRRKRHHAWMLEKE